MPIPPPPPPHLAHLATQRTPVPPPPPAHLAHLAAQVERVRVAVDTECYGDYWLLMAKRVSDRAIVAVIEAFPGQPIDRQALDALLRSCTMVTFNGKGYDDHMIAAALAGYDTRQLKYLSDRIIVGRMKPWDIEREYKLSLPAYADSIDLMPIMPGEHGLKMYMAKMHSRRIQELPIDPGASILPEMRPRMREYCGNDLDGNIDGYLQFEKEIKLREVMSREYGVDLRSKSDAQIAEAVIVHELGGTSVVPRPEWAAGTWFNYEPPAYLQFQTPLLQQLLEIVRRARFVLGESGIELPPELANAKIRIGGGLYTLGIGGLHSNEKSAYHVSDGETVLQDVDVASFYPRLMLNSGAYPAHMGPAFLRVFESIVQRRLAAKNAGDKSTADTLKIVINGTFGKTLSKYGRLVAPKMGIQTTITGQLSLLMLIEHLEGAGIPVVSANTDGIVIKCPRALTWLRDDIVRQWEQRAGLETEAVDYAAIYSRDVNNYIAIKPSGEVKTKGEYAPTKPVGGSWPNPTGYISVEAVIAYLQHRAPLEQTVRACTDMRKFVHVRNVSGGGVKFYGDQIEKMTTQGGMRAQLVAAGWVEVEPKLFGEPCGGPPLPMKDAYKLALQQLRDDNPVRREYLGKVVRWYYGAGEPGAIRYQTSGNLVPKTEGAVPCMVLPNQLPANIDYDWYVREARSMLSDLGLPVL